MDRFQSAGCTSEKVDSRRRKLRNGRPKNKKKKKNQREIFYTKQVAKEKGVNTAHHAAQENPVQIRHFGAREELRFKSRTYKEKKKKEQKLNPSMARTAEKRVKKSNGSFEGQVGGRRG